MNNISALPIVAKIKERIVFNQLYDYLQEHSLLTPHQSGFRPGHSTQDVLIKTIDDWRKEMDKDHIVSTLFMDLSKAFDTIDHQPLLGKSDTLFGVRGRENLWFRRIDIKESCGESSSSWLIPKLGAPHVYPVCERYA